MKKSILLFSAFFSVAVLSSLNSENMAQNVVLNPEDLSENQIYDTSKNDNFEIVQAAYDVAFEKIIADSQEDLSIEERVIREQLAELPLFPLEEKLSYFPAPISPNEKNPEKLAEYFVSVASAYSTHAKDLAQRYSEYETQRARTKQSIGLRTFRTQDQKLETNRSLTRNKDFLFGKTIPAKSEKYFPPRIEQRSHSNYSHDAFEQKRKMEISAVKGNFYMIMARALLPNELYDEKEA